MIQELSGQLDMDAFFSRSRTPSSLNGVAAGELGACLPKLSVCTGWSLLEAMACGCCIVGSHGMPVAEAIEHDVEGRLVHMDDLLLSLRSMTLAVLKSSPFWYCGGGERCFTISVSLTAMTSLIESQGDVITEL